MGASELRDQTLDRQRALAARHEDLCRLGPGSGAEELEPVFDATNDLVAVLDRVAARTARRRRSAAFALLALVVVLAALTAAALLPGYVMAGVLVLLVVAAGLWLSIR